MSSEVSACVCIRQGVCVYMCYISCYLSSFLPTYSSRRHSEYSVASLGEHLHLFHGLLLLLWERAEELDLLFVGRAPLVVDLERALQVLLHLHVEGLRLQGHERRVVNTRDRLRWHQVVQVPCQLCELCTRCLLLPDTVIERNSIFNGNVLGVSGKFGLAEDYLKWDL